MTDLVRDVRHAARRLARTPMFTLATLLTLALGIGANVAIFTIVNTVLLKPLPFREADRLVGLWQTAPGVDIEDLSIPSVIDFEDTAALTWTGIKIFEVSLAEVIASKVRECE